MNNIVRDRSLLHSNNFYNDIPLLFEKSDFKKRKKIELIEFEKTSVPEDRSTFRKSRFSFAKSETKQINIDKGIQNHPRSFRYCDKFLAFSMFGSKALVPEIR